MPWCPRLPAPPSGLPAKESPPPDPRSRRDIRRSRAATRARPLRWQTSSSRSRRRPGVEAVAIDRLACVGIDQVLADVPARMTEFDRQHVQYVLELDGRARLVKVGEPCGLDDATRKQAPDDGQGRARIIRARMAQEAPRMVTEEFGVAQAGLDRTGCGPHDVSPQCAVLAAAEGSTLRFIRKAKITHDRCCGFRETGRPARPSRILDRRPPARQAFDKTLADPHHYAS